MENTGKAVYHLPGLFEFYELYRRFLPLFYSHREWFYDWCEIGSVYGAPADCLWGGGRVGFGDADAENVFALMNEYGISARLTFSNSLLREEHLKDTACNDLCRRFEKSRVKSGIIIASDLLLQYIQKNYPGFYFVSSTTKVLTDQDRLLKEINREDYLAVVPDFRMNKIWNLWEKLLQPQKDKIEFLCNECCWTCCADRRACYENVSRKSLGEEVPDHICRAPDAAAGYRFSEAMKKPEFIGIREILENYLPLGFSNFKIEGRSLGSAVVFEMLLYYLVKPEYQLKMREMIYLENELDLF